MSEELLKLRKDIVNFILENHDNKNIYFNLINDKNSSSFNGFLYESIIELLIISKCMADIDYDEIIEVNAGLATGDKLITKGYQGLYDGQLISKTN